MSVAEAQLTETSAGVVPVSPGWFVLNARDARWTDRPGQGASLPLTGWTEEEVEGLFPHLGINIRYAGSGQAIARYHREPEQEGFLVLDGDGTLIIEGTERPLRRWDYVHCPPGTLHTLVGGTRGIVVLCAGSRVVQADPEAEQTEYPSDPAAARHSAAAIDPEDPYGVFAEHVAAPFRDPWLGPISA